MEVGEGEKWRWRLVQEGLYEFVTNAFELDLSASGV